MPIHPRTCSFLYSVSCLLDAVDGMVARKFNQSTQFGAVLDMTIDRCTTSCLLVFLAIAYPKWSILFQGLISLDFSSHFMHVYATLAMGTANQSHKKINENRPWAMRIYYSNVVCRCWICLVGQANMSVDCAFCRLFVQWALFHHSLPRILLITDSTNRSNFLYLVRHWGTYYNKRNVDHI